MTKPKVYSRPQDVDLRSLTEIIYVIAMNIRIYPNMSKLLGDKYKTKVLNTLLTYGILPASKYEKFCSGNYLNCSMLINRIIDNISDNITLTDFSQMFMSRDIIRAYIMALTMLNDHDAFEEYFYSGMVLVGASDASIPYGHTAYEPHRKVYMEQFKPLLDKQWDLLCNIKV